MDDDICSICGDKLDNEYNHTLKCNHKYHYQCILLSFKNMNNNECPYCRSPNNILPVINGLKKLEVGVHINVHDYYKNKGLGTIYNNKLQNIPPKLIKEGDKNKLIKSIGDDRNINTNVVSSKIINFSDNNYNVWEYENEKPINGGDFFNNVVGYNGDMDNVLEVDEKYNGKYSI